MTNLSTQESDVLTLPSLSETEDQLWFTVDRNQLLRALTHAHSVVEKRNIRPILSNIKLELVGSTLILTATDMDLSITETLEVTANLSTQMGVALHASTIYEIVRKLPEGSNISFNFYSTEQGKLSIISSNCKFSLSYLSIDEFPTMTSDDLTHHFSLTSSQLQSLIEKTFFAISTEETRYTLNGIYLHLVSGEANQIRTVATDGHRLSYAEEILNIEYEDMPSVIIPKKTALELKKLVDETNGEIEISLSTSKLQIKSGNITLTSKLIDGNFPDYEMLIPQNNDKILEVDVSSFTKAVDRISSISVEKFRHINFSLSHNKLILSATGESNGYGMEELVVEYAENDLNIGFNARYILDVMSVIEGKKAVLIFSDENSPVILRDKDDLSATYVIMPMRV